jgi:hypothetical protein
MTIIRQNGNLIGTFPGIGVAPPAGASIATIAAVLSSQELADPTNHLRLRVWADFGAGPVPQPQSLDWQGGPNAVAPTLTASFSKTNPPRLVYGVLENGTAGDGSAVLVSKVTIAFS